MASRTHNVAVIGYGLSAKVFHIPLIDAVPELKLYSILQRHPQPDNDASKNHPNAKIFHAAEEMLQDTSVDIVVVTTPPPTHFELTKLALENGKHVIVEKPFVPTSKEADQLIDLAKQQDRLLSVYHNRRWDSDFLTLHALLQTNALGRVVEFASHFDRHKPSLAGAKAWKSRPEPGGGAIYDLGTHLLDQAILLFGLPRKLTAFLGSQRQGTDAGYEDSCTVLLHYDGGMLATLKVAVVSPEARQLRFWVRGERGSFWKYHADPQEGHLAEGKSPDDAGFGIEPDEWAGTLTTIDDDNDDSSTLTARPYPTILPPPTYKSFYTQFVRALRSSAEAEGKAGGKAGGRGRAEGRGADESIGASEAREQEDYDVPVPPQDAAAIIRLVELAKRSSHEGRTVEV
ncbi:MAG: hypothetical protein LQ348_005947 [Seirophora lacunosa]|nr:MAG: hypothetical protein LQ348_005947 [Seirophora lacunosa]